MIDIIIPVYNEENNIRFLFDDIQKKVKSEIRVNIIYDFSNDKTLDVIKNIKKDYSFIIRCIKNIKKGAAWALRTGFIKCDAEFLLVLMADCSDDISLIDKMYYLINNGYDIVCPSRYCRKGKQFGGGFLKTILSRYAGISLRFVTGIRLHDWTNNYRLYRKNFINNIKLESNHGFEIGIELLYIAYCRKNRILEIPCIWNDRKMGVSKFKILKWMPYYLKWYIKIVIKAGERVRSEKESS